MLVLVLPAINENKDKTIETLQAQVESYQGETNMTPEEVLAMREKVTTLEAENKQLRSEETKQANLELLETAVSQLNDKKFEECVATLDSIETCLLYTSRIEKKALQKLCRALEGTQG